MASMRKIVVFNRVSADGYFAGPDGGLDWVIPDDEVDRSGAAGIPRTDTVLFGRKTYDLMESFWPRALKEDVVPDPHNPSRGSGQQSAFAVALNEMTKLVFSRTRKEVTWNNSRLVPEFDPREIETLKRQPGKDIIVFGSGSIVSQLTQHGLVDEYHFVVSPILLGSGRQLLSGVPKRLKLDLKEAKPFPSGNVMLRYAREN